MRKWLRERFSRHGGRGELGTRGEALAATHLKALGFEVVARNVRVRLGRSPTGRRVWGEIDIVAYDGDTLAFVEVKTRRSEGLYPTETAVGARKRGLLAASARRYRRSIGVWGEPYRFDVVTVIVPDTGPPRVMLTRGYFSEARAAREDR